MKPNIIIISSSRSDRWLLGQISEKLGENCWFMNLRNSYDPYIGHFDYQQFQTEMDYILMHAYDKTKAVLLGDRHETCLMAYHFAFNKIPIVHIHGGEETSGSADNLYRNAITKLSHVHLTSHKQFSDRIIRMGENPECVFTVGSLGVYRAKKFMEKACIKKSKKLSVILHPNTIEPDKTEQECLTLLDTLKSFSDFSIDFYAPNYDSGREIIESHFKAFCKANSNAFYFEEKPRDYFMNSLAKSMCLIGNSSCGIIEAPSLSTPTINIGNRQDGRPMAASIINTTFGVAAMKVDIKYAIEHGHQFDFTNPYDNTEEDTVDKICDIIRNHPVKFAKHFVD